MKIFSMQRLACCYLPYVTLLGVLAAGTWWFWRGQMADLLVVGMLALLGSVALWLHRWFQARSLQKISKQVTAAKASYLEFHPETFTLVRDDSMPELTEVIDAINTFVAEAHGNRLLFANVAQSISQHAKQVFDSAHNILEQMEHQNAETSAVHTSLQSLHAVFALTADTAREAIDVASASEEEGNKGKLVVTEAMGCVMSLSGAISSAGDVVAQLGQESESIKSVVSVIRGVAEQTNLLALNAAIEAARAGEQGRGFAVVADEVRNLASKTQTYTDDIESIIEKLLKLVESANQSLSETMQISSQSDELIESVVMSYSELVGSLMALKNVGNKLSEATLQEADSAKTAYSRLADVQQHSAITMNILRTAVGATENLDTLAGQICQLAGHGDELLHASKAAPNRKLSGDDQTDISGALF